MESMDIIFYKNKIRKGVFQLMLFKYLTSLLTAKAR